MTPLNILFKVPIERSVGIVLSPRSLLIQMLFSVFWLSSGRGLGLDLVLWPMLGLELGLLSLGLLFLALSCGPRCFCFLVSLFNELILRRKT